MIFGFLLPNRATAQPIINKIVFQNKAPSPIPIVLMIGTTLKLPVDLRRLINQYGVNTMERVIIKNVPKKSRLTLGGRKIWENRESHKR